jgi:hydroxyacylglutathione hydrolase
MNRLAEDVFQIPLAPRSAINAYLLGDVLVDAGTAGSAKRILRALQGHGVVAHALTHAHIDHAGGSKKVVDALDIPMWAPAGDAAAVEAGKPDAADNMLRPVASRSGWRPVPVARRLQEGDEVGPGFAVLDVPGHSPGHVAFWRESDRTLVCGDVFFHMSLLTLRPQLREPIAPFTNDPARNRESMRRLAALQPELVLFGHGIPLRDPAKLKAYADALPA